VNYFDVADLPGDVPAGCAFAVNDDNNEAYVMRWGVVEGDHALKFTPQWEAEDFVTPGGFLTEPPEASASGAYYVRFTPLNAGDEATIDFDLIASGGTWEELQALEGSYHVYVRVREKSAGRKFYMKMRPETYYDWLGDYSDQTDALPLDDWGLVNLGKVDIPPVEVRDEWPLHSLTIKVWMQSKDATGTLDVDYLLLVPSATGGVVSFSKGPLLYSFVVDTTVDPPLAQVMHWNETTGGYRTTPQKGVRYLGHYPELKPNSRAKFILSADRARVMDYDNLDAYDTDSALFTSTTYEYLAQEIYAYNAGNVQVVWLYLKAVGTLTDNLTLEIQTDSGGEPSGTPVTNGVSSSVAMSGISTSDYAWVAFTFSPVPSVSADTIYHLVLKSDQGAADASNYIVWGQDTNGAYALGNCETYDSVGAAWTTWADYDYLFKFYLGGNELDDTYDVRLKYEPRFLLCP